MFNSVDLQKFHRPKTTNHTFLMKGFVVFKNVNGGGIFKVVESTNKVFTALCISKRFFSSSRVRDFVTTHGNFKFHELSGTAQVHTLAWGFGRMKPEPNSFQDFIKEIPEEYSFLLVWEDELNAWFVYQRDFDGLFSSRINVNHLIHRWEEERSK